MVFKIMEWNNFKSNSIAGDQFICDMQQAFRKREVTKEQFVQFINDNGFKAWHIHDGWVMKDHRSGDVLIHEEIHITWITSHGGSSHTWICPNVGEKMVVIGESPGWDLKPFKMWCYEVIDKKHGNDWISDSITLRKFDIKTAEFNEKENKYQFVEKKSSVGFLEMISKIFK